MDAVFLSRIQFALNAGFHFIFPPLTFGVTLVILIVESIYLKTGEEIYKKLNKFLVKVLGLIFAMGVATGIVLEFSFGTNWSNYSRMVGDIFGAPLAAEAVLSFFLESVFLGVLLFAREKISKKAYWVSAFLVFFASHLSGLWIIIANSWMQTPAGYKIENGRAFLTDFFAAAINPSTLERYIHTVVGAWITGSLFIAGIAAWYLLKNREKDYAKTLLKIALTIFIATSFLQFLTGHSHSIQVAKTQPEKMASFEALWKTSTKAPMSLFGIPDEKNQKTNMEISIPSLLSFMIHFDTNAEVKGLEEFKKEERPPLVVTYMSYHVMIILGVFFAFMSAAGLLLLATKKVYEARWYLTLLLLSIPLPLIANEFGWFAAEVGRQPWAVYKVMKTSEAASVVVPAEQILFTIIMFSVIYLLLFIVFVRLLSGLIKKGPDKISTGY